MIGEVTETEFCCCNNVVVVVVVVVAAAAAAAASAAAGVVIILTQPVTQWNSGTEYFNLHRDSNETVCFFLQIFSYFSSFVRATKPCQGNDPRMK